MLSPQATRTQAEVGEKVYLLLWVATLLQASLILWELLTLLHPIDPLLPSIHATPFSTSAYLVFQLAYMGKKEFIRWTKGVSGWLSSPTPGKLEEAELLKRIRRGDTAVLIWGALLLLSVTLHALHQIPQLPQELFRTSIQVIALYSLALVSKSKKAALEGEKGRKGSEGVVRAKVEEEGRDEWAEKILGLIQKKERSRDEISKELGLSRSRTGDYLRQLMEEGKVVKEGAGPRTVYGTGKKS